MRALLVVLLLAGSASAADVVSTLAPMLPGETDTSHVSNLSCEGKWYYRVNVPGFGPFCWWLDCAKLKQDVWKVADGIASGERPMYDIAKYQACIADPALVGKCTATPYWVKVGTIPVNARCDPVSVRKTSSSDYHKTTNAAGVSGAAWCKLTVVNQLPQKKWRPTGALATEVLGTLVSPETPTDTAICQELLPAVTPTVIANDYTFYCLSDDGCRVSVNGVLVVDSWKAQSPTEVSGRITLAPGTYPIKVEYFEASGGAGITVSYSSGAISKKPVPGNFTGSYFANENLTDPAIARADATIDFNWGSGAPMAGVPSDHFSVRWIGQLTVP